MAGVARMSTFLVEVDDRWLLPLAGQRVERLCVGFAVTLLFTGGAELRIEQPFVVTSSEGTETLVVPEGSPAGLGPAVELVRRDVAHAEAFKDGHLELSFGDGATLGVPADEGFEAWELVGPDGMRTVSLPGGDLAVWQPGEAGGS